MAVLINDKGIVVRFFDEIFWRPLFPSFSDPPEISIEQNWYERDGEIEVELICIVHAEPEATVTKDKKLYISDEHKL